MVLSSELLLAAYSQGIFPMGSEFGIIFWYDPDPRAILPLDRFHISRSLARKIKQEYFTIRLNTAFPEVIRACADSYLGRRTSWINDEIIVAYEELHHLGFAHSVEAWRNNELVGGLYGVAINGFFAGESMFSRERDSSKVALVYLVRRLQQRGFHILDIQYMTDHLKRFGAVEIPQSEYKKRLVYALQLAVTFADPPLS